MIGRFVCNLESTVCRCYACRQTGPSVTTITLTVFYFFTVLHVPACIKQSSGTNQNTYDRKLVNNKLFNIILEIV